MKQLSTREGIRPGGLFGAIGLGLVVLAAVPVAAAVDPGRLILPKKYQHLMPQLQQVADLAEQTTRCQKVIRGQFLIKQSRADSAIYLVTCQNILRASYTLTYRYDGRGAALIEEQGSADMLRAEQLALAARARGESAITAAYAGKADRDADNPEPVSESDDPQAVALQRQQLYAQALAAGDMETIRRLRGDEASQDSDKDKARQSCERQLAHQTKDMIAVAVLQDAVRESYDEMSGWSFLIPFDARSLRGAALHFEASCHVMQTGSSVLDIRPRKD